MKVNALAAACKAQEKWAKAERAYRQAIVGSAPATLKREDLAARPGLDPPRDEEHPRREEDERERYHEPGERIPGVGGALQDPGAA